MRVYTHEFTKHTAKEIIYKPDNIEDIKKAEKQKARLENEGYNLTYTNVGFLQTTLIYKKYK